MQRPAATCAMTPSSKKMVVGFNHNIKHKGKVYHVQTEDSGVDNPHLITHLFVGGNILASKRSTYRHLMSGPAAVAPLELEAHVRSLMEAQHKEMLRGLVNGSFEKQEAQVSGRSFQPGELASGAPAAPPQMLPRATASPLTEEGIGSIFAEDSVSEKSLDEVILGYLAGETEK